METTDQAKVLAERLLASDDELFEMANLTPRRTGLKQRLWVSVNLHGRHHRPRLKVEGTDKQFYPVSIDDDVAFLAGWPPGFSAIDFQSLEQFVNANRDVLLRYWNDQIDTEEMIQSVRSV